MARSLLYPYGAPYELERSLFSGWTQTVEDSFSMRNPLAGYAVSVTGTLALLALVTGFVPGGSNQSLEARHRSEPAGPKGKTLCPARCFIFLSSFGKP